ncbi:MAG: sortase [Chloroflexota bacterium]
MSSKFKRYVIIGALLFNCFISLFGLIFISTLIYQNIRRANANEPYQYDAAAAIEDQLMPASPLLSPDDEKTNLAAKPRQPIEALDETDLELLETENQNRVIIGSMDEREVIVRALEEQPMETPIPTATPWPDLATTLSIPAINVSREIANIPLENGQWDISALDDAIGHLDGTGKHPNDRLSMTFVGHVTTVWPFGGPFERLEHLSLGDEVHYRIGDQLYIYEITRFLKVDPSRVDLMFNTQGDQILLVTCFGYNLFTAEYDTRLIAQATHVRTDTVQIQNGLEN